MESTNLKLYQIEGCPFCQLVRKKLTMLQIPALMIPVSPNGDDRKELIELSGQKAVPVLQDGDEVIVDSSVILEYLDKKFGDGSNNPLPGNDYGIRKEIKGTAQEVLEKTITSFEAQGFRLLTQINVKKTLKEEIETDVAANFILGFCEPQSFHQMMEAEPDIGLLLPFNVVVREKSESVYLVTAVNPMKMFSVVGRNDLIDLTMTVRRLLGKAIESIN